MQQILMLFGPAMNNAKVYHSMAKWNKIAKSFPMWSKGNIIIAQFSKYKIMMSQKRRSFSMLSILKMLSTFSGSRGPQGPDLPY